MWALVSVNVGAFFSQGDEGAQVLLHLDEFEETILDPKTSRAVRSSARRRRRRRRVLTHLAHVIPRRPRGAPSQDLTERLERVSRGAALNDSLKLAVLSSPRLFDFLLGLLEPRGASAAAAAASATADAPAPADGAGAAAGQTARNHAAKVLEAVTRSGSAQRALVEKGEHVRLIRLMGDSRSPLYLRKVRRARRERRAPPHPAASRAPTALTALTAPPARPSQVLASCVVNLAQHPDNAAALGAAGAVGALHSQQASDARVRRQAVQVATSRLAAAVAAADAASGGELTRGLPRSERELIGRLAAEEAAAAQRPLHSARATLVESGVLLYLHTAAGGAAWGLFESVRRSEPRDVLLRNVARTSLVTCLVPILLVGGVVTAYERTNKSTDSIDQKFALYASACMAIYPAHRLLAWVETFAPLWLGGHIVGFSSFFVWTLYTESDLLKSDRELLELAAAGGAAADGASAELGGGAPRPRKKVIKTVWEARKPPDAG